MKIRRWALKKALNFTVVCLIGRHTIIFAQTLPATPWLITSDYGPRNVAKGSWHHRGIDYAGRYGDDIVPVEGGTIEFIKYERGWAIEIAGSHGRWKYLHIFSGSGSLPVISGNWELRNATLVNPNNPNDIRQSNAIILWSGQRAIKVLCARPNSNYWVRSSGDSYVLGTDGEHVKTRTSVSSLEPIAPVGNSGGYATHLHLGLNDGEDNPLLYVQHPPDNLPTTTIENPPDGYIFTREELGSDYPVKIRVNSIGGLDLDKADILVYREMYPSQVIRLGGNHTFCYGGVEGENKADIYL